MSLRIIPLLLVSAMSAAQLHAAEVTVEKSEKWGVIVKIDGQSFTEYPDRLRLQTDPMADPRPDREAHDPGLPHGEGRQGDRDHVHQRSLWFTHGDVTTG